VKSSNDVSIIELEDVYHVLREVRDIINFTKNNSILILSKKWKKLIFFFFYYSVKYF